MKCRPDKCKLGIREIKFLGHIVSGEGVKSDPEKVSVLKKLKLPTTLKQLQSHLGCYNYFSRYIKDFATLAAPLYQKIKKNIKFEFNDEDIKNWKRLRDSLIDDCMLIHLDITSAPATSIYSYYYNADYADKLLMILLHATCVMFNIVEGALSQ